MSVVSLPVDTWEKVTQFFYNASKQSTVCHGHLAAQTCTAVVV